MDFPKSKEILNILTIEPTFCEIDAFSVTKATLQSTMSVHLYVHHKPEPLFILHLSFH